jgi:hypothetical protein
MTLLLWLACICLEAIITYAAIVVDLPIIFYPLWIAGTWFNVGVLREHHRRLCSQWKQKREEKDMRLWWEWRRNSR